MVDINTSADVKVVGLPVAPAATEIEDRSRPQVQPAREGANGNDVSLNQRAMQRRSEEKQATALSAEEVSKAVEQVQKRLDAIGGNLTIGFGKAQNVEAIVVQVREKKSGEVVRQFPPEEVLDLRKKLEDVIGLLFDKKV